MRACKVRVLTPLSPPLSPSVALLSPSRQHERRRRQANDDDVVVVPTNGNYHLTPTSPAAFSLRRRAEARVTRVTIVVPPSMLFPEWWMGGKVVVKGYPRSTTYSSCNTLDASVALNSLSLGL